jgi:regulation of enolase protein 1 (concanavalin A-like superfamily)
MTMTTYLPPLDWTPVSGAAVWDADALTLTADAGVDWTNDALGGEQQHRAAALGFAAPPEFSLSARVAVDGDRTTFDAGALVIWADPDHWAKLCFEFSPRGEAMVVSVVTNDYSDDCNGTVVTADAVWLRISRIGAGWAFHSSIDGSDWAFVRLFRLHTDAPVTVGFLAQAPMGDTAVARFDEIRYAETVPADLRDGS